MKKKTLILLCGVILVCLPGCSSEKETKGKDYKINYNVSLSLKDESLSNSGATFVLKNDSKKYIIYGNPYWLEKENDGQWSKVKTGDNFNFASPALELKSEDTKEIDLDWKSIYGELPDGKYRIVKSISVQKEDDTYEDFFVIEEFTIGELTI